MKPYNEVFHRQIAYLLKQYRDGHVKTVPDLMTLIEMSYGDYIDCHPNELPETYEQPRSVIKESGGEREVSPS